MTVNIPALTPNQQAIMFAPPLLDERIAAAMDQGFLIDTPTLLVGKVACCHKCSRSTPTTTFTMGDTHSTATYGVCSCNELYLMHFEVWT